MAGSGTEKGSGAEEAKVDLVRALPHELVLLILYQLDVDDVLAAQLVSKAWAAAVGDEFLWRKLFAKHLPATPLAEVRTKVDGVAGGWRRYFLWRFKVGRFFEDDRPCPYARATTGRSSCFYCRTPIAQGAFRAAIVIRGVQSVPYVHMGCDLATRAKHMTTAELAGFVVPGAAHLDLDADDKAELGGWILDLLDLRASFDDAAFNAIAKHKATPELRRFSASFRAVEAPACAGITHPDGFLGGWPPKRTKCFGPRIFAPSAMNAWQLERIFPLAARSAWADFDWPLEDAFDERTNYPEFLYLYVAMQDLPAELLGEIASWLDVVELSAFSAVCTAFRAVAASPLTARPVLDAWLARDWADPARAVSIIQSLASAALRLANDPESELLLPREVAAASTAELALTLARPHLALPVVRGVLGAVGPVCSNLWPARADHLDAAIAEGCVRLAAAIEAVEARHGNVYLMLEHELQMARRAALTLALGADADGLILLVAKHAIARVRSAVPHAATYIPAALGLAAVAANAPSALAALHHAYPSVINSGWAYHGYRGRTQAMTYPLMVAAFYAADAAAGWLVSIAPEALRPALVDKVEGRFGQTALHVAVQRDVAPFGVVRTLVAAGASTTTQDRHGFGIPELVRGYRRQDEIEAIFALLAGPSADNDDGGGGVAEQ
ncbi:uncharacterized protein AMSG_12148 [Thecamonas trahens ATCC 50062]|uniref:F-box domain-containing protein n=1 Tax=Thecamonas trahens ATCC 50062 TaxID=461836 RepID=A0A0L0DHX8_THETB|nr:hypothetical protein AMSG_12148 [Thecamonas trahens ATCC 50062]KNC51974.1 hypothetical protein AMSG_12148 [Thecamonas trahens ATCC 50062]|eukprot:XP_013755633.1 hypothetical protein AMSG_12148 [Thecamonas trahens ATCC 50062]